MSMAFIDTGLKIIVDKKDVNTPEFFNRLSEAMGYDVSQACEIRSKNDYFNIVGFLLTRLIDRPLISLGLSIPTESVIVDQLFKLNVIKKERKKISYRIKASDESKGSGHVEFSEFSIYPDKLQSVKDFVETFNLWINSNDEFESDLKNRLYDLGIRQVPY